MDKSFRDGVYLGSEEHKIRWGLEDDFPRL